MIFKFNFVISGLFLSCLVFSPVAEAIDCTSSKQEWIKLRYTALANFQSASNTAPPNVCQVPDGSSCCDREMEREMYVLAERKLVQQGNAWLQLARQMENHSTALQYFFRSDLDHAKNRLHQFFSRIYGYNYKLHRSFFFGFFTNLEEYMAGRRGKLGQLVDNFFSQLRDSIVGLIERSGQVNSNPIFNEAGANGAGGTGSSIGGVSGGSSAGTNTAAFGHGSAGSNDEATETRRIRCLSDRVAQIRPFDDVDVRLRARMLEAYPPARMLVNVLMTTSRILTHLTDQIPLRPECVTAVTRYHFCALCAGRSTNDVCPDSCQRLLSTCFHADGPSEAQLAFIWPQLIDAIVLATSRLERSFNFPAVNRHLQMEISEAITSLQTRYAETKSKFESECRFGSAGRKVPNLFNPTGPNSRDLGSSASPARPNSWSRFKRSPDSNETATEPPSPLLNRVRRLAAAAPMPASAQLSSSSASQELLDWQTRQRSSFGGSMDSSQSDYGSQSGSWDGTDTDDSSNVPDRLIRWAGQLKRTYTAVRNLFNQPAGDLCSDQTNKDSGAQSKAGNCWNPPVLQPTSNTEITLVLRQLNEAAKRLQEASTTTRDPDTLVLHLQSRSAPRHAIYPKNVQRDSFGFPNDPNNFDSRSQWPSNNRQPDYPSQANRPTGVEGSGMDSSTAAAAGVQQPSSPTQIESSGMGPGKRMDNLFDQEPPQAPQAPPSKQQQQQSTNWDKWQTNNRAPPNEWESSGTVGEQDSFLENTALVTSTPEPPTTTASTTTTSTTTTTTAPPRVEQPRTTTSTTTTTRTTTPVPTPTTTRSTSTSTTTTTTTTTMATTTARLKPPVATKPRKEPDTWPSRPDMMAPSTEPTTMAPGVTPGRFGHPDSYGLLPDDEDKIQPGGQSPQVQEPWSQNSGSSGPTNWELNPNQGSGMSPSTFPSEYGNSRPDRQRNEDKNKHDWAPPDSNQGSQGSSQYIYPEGSGGSQREPPPSDPSRMSPDGSRDRPSQWRDRYDQNVPSFPDSTGSGTTPAGEWSDRSKNEFMGGSHDWQEQVEGSATVAPEYTQTQPYDEDDTPSRQFETMPPRPAPPSQPQPQPQSPREHHLPSLVPHPPLPPAEVWIPARLAPGQPAPSILFIREYNIEGPLYEHENHQTNACPSKVRIIHWVLALVFLLPMFV